MPLQQSRMKCYETVEARDAPSCLAVTNSVSELKCLVPVGNLPVLFTMLHCPLSRDYSGEAESSDGLVGKRHEICVVATYCKTLSFLKLDEFENKLEVYLLS